MNNNGLRGLNNVGTHRNGPMPSQTRDSFRPKFDKPNPFKDKPNPFNKLAKIEGREARQTMNSQGQNIIHNKERGITAFSNNRFGGNE